MKTAAQLIRDIAEQEKVLRTQRSLLGELQKACKHQFGPIRYVPDVTEGFRTHGDPPGTMGIDWQGPMRIPGKTTPKWTRTCPLCELAQTTPRPEQRPCAGSVLVTAASEDLPVFDELRRF